MHYTMRTRSAHLHSVGPWAWPNYSKAQLPGNIMAARPSSVLAKVIKLEFILMTQSKIISFCCYLSLLTESIFLFIEKYKDIYKGSYRMSIDKNINIKQNLIKTSHVKREK